MELSHQAKAELGAKTTLKPVASDMFSGRKALWMAGFALFSTAFFLLSPGIGATLAFSLVISFAHVVFVGRARERFMDSALLCTIAGSMLAAALLWMSLLAGNHGVGLLGFAGASSAPVIASVLSLLSFAVLVVLENAAAMATLFMVSKSHNAATDAACLLDMKCAGLFGETC